MNQLIHHAKTQVKVIHLESKSILPDHKLCLHKSTIGFEVAQVYDGWIPYMPEIMCFGSHPLTIKQVKTIISDNENLEYL